MDASEVWSAQERAWLGLWLSWGYAPASFAQLRARCGGVLDAFSWEPEALRALGVAPGLARSLGELAQRGELVASLGEAASSAWDARAGKAVVRCDGALGALLRGVMGRGAPPYLFVWGDAGLLEHAPNACAAVVGSREADEATCALTKAVARGLVERGLVVVSGGARGVDAAAHEAALEAGGRTLAVLGGGLDQLYPASNRALFHRVLEGGGLLLSPFAPRQEVRRHNFPRRNPLIAALSVLTIVTRAGADSGSLLTAREALRAGRGVLAAPGGLDEPACSGANLLLVEGAWPLVRVEHLSGWIDKARALGQRPAPTQLALLPSAYLAACAAEPKSGGAGRDESRGGVAAPSAPAATRREPAVVAARGEARAGQGAVAQRRAEGVEASAPPLEGQEGQLAELLRGGARHQDELCRALECSAGRVGALLLGLELRGRVSRGVGGVWRLSP